jgi:hypothetical protein
MALLAVVLAACSYTPTEQQTAFRLVSCSTAVIEPAARGDEVGP